MNRDLLPLFPLHTVLFPRMPLPLHIFEERYKRMIRRCLDEERPFGVVLIREGREVGPAAVPHSIGTLAHLHAVSPLPEERLNVLAVGTERFRLLDYLADAEPYLVGRTEAVQDDPGDPAVLTPLVSDVAALFRDYFHLLVAHAGVEMPEYELPDDAEEFSFVIAAVVQADSGARQAFLEMTDTAARLTVQRDLLTQELARLRQMTEMEFSEVQRVESSRWKPFVSRN